MEYPIIQVKTEDNLWLHGLYLRAADKNTIFINIHGTASNFYEEYFIEVLADRFLKENISMLSTNNRGSGVYDAYQKSGTAVEKFEDCVIDIDAWMEFAIKEGYKNIILSGHSLGTEKVVYYMSHGKHSDKVTAVVLLAPADSYGSHRVLDGEVNLRLREVEALIKKSEDLINQNKGEEFLPRNAYGSRGGIMPKSAESFVNFLGEKSKVLEGLPFNTGKLTSYSKIAVPILVVIGDQEEYTAIPIKDALKLMEEQNKNTKTYQFENCDHDFTDKEEELVGEIIDFIRII